MKKNKFIFSLCCVAVFSMSIIPFVYAKQSKILVVYEDGVNRNEAMLIAREQLKKSEHKKNYKRNTGKVQQDILAKDYEDFWFVSFDSGKFTMAFWSFLVVIHKKSGEVFYADAYIPLDVMNYDWIFELDK